MKTSGTFGLRACAALACALLGFGNVLADGGVERTWTGGGDGKSWADPANWSPTGVPGGQDDVIVGAGASPVLAEATPVFDSVSIGGTLTFTNWMTRLNAGAVVVNDGGVVTCAGPFKDEAMSNRVWIACNTLDVKSGGVIHADKRGYAALNGPGMKNFTASQRKTFRGGTYGGTAPGSGVKYGSMIEPTDPGTGGCGQQTPASAGEQNAGGGAIRIEATGDVLVDGRISANGATVVAWRASAGSGGSVYIGCRTIRGSGRVSASSEDYPSTSTQDKQFQGGSGGRIAVHYSPTAQSAYDASGCTVGFYASGAVGWYVADYTALTAEGYLNNSGKRPANIASGGTLYFPDNRFLTNAAYASAGRRFSGEWHSAERRRADIESPGDFKLDGLLDLREAVERLDVGGSLIVNGVHGRSAGLMLSNAVARIDGDCTLTGGCLDLNGGNFSIGGNMLMTGANESDPIVCAQMHLRSLPTNGVDRIWGAQFDVGKTWTMSGKTVVYPYTHGTKGSVPFFHATSFVLGEDAVLDGCMKGYDKGYGPGSAGGMSVDLGASHGGKGGCSPASVSKLKPTYGVKERPVTPGSGGGDTNGRSGGSAIIIHVDNKMTFNGAANVQGRCDNPGWAAGGSGGSVYLSAKKFESETGRICAKGGRGSGDASYSRGIGGGGRVAIWAQDFGTTNIEINVTGGTPGNDKQVEAEPGTIYWGVIPPKPGFIIFVQ